NDLSERIGRVQEFPYERLVHDHNRRSARGIRIYELTPRNNQAAESSTPTGRYQVHRTHTLALRTRSSLDRTEQNRTADGRQERERRISNAGTRPNRITDPLKQDETLTRRDTCVRRIDGCHQHTLGLEAQWDSHQRRERP